MTRTLLRIATFNVENLLTRFDFSGFTDADRADRVLQLFDIADRDQFRQLEGARVIAQADDARQQSALAIAAAGADVVCLQEVESLDALDAFETGYLHRLLGAGYRLKHVSAGNDTRGIDLGIMARPITAAGASLDVVGVVSHAALTFGDIGMDAAACRRIDAEPTDRVFKRDCLEVNLLIDGKPMSLFVVHFKSMGPARKGVDGRAATMPRRHAEALSVRHVISQAFGGDAQAGDWAICGDLIDYLRRVVVSGGPFETRGFTAVEEDRCGFDPLLVDGFAIDPCASLPATEAWTLYHARGPDLQHLCQLDYILLSPALAARSDARPRFVRAGQPHRTPFPPGLDIARFPRIGWDRPKASDHCPLVVEIAL